MAAQSKEKNKGGELIKERGGESIKRKRKEVKLKKKYGVAA